MQLPKWLVGFIDPASREFDRQAEAHRPADAPRRFREPRSDSMFSGGAVMTPEGSRQATDEELADMRTQSQRYRGAMQLVLDQLHADYDEELRAAARDLLAEGRAQLVHPDAVLDAELTRPWRGDRVLRIVRATGNSLEPAGSSMVRVPRSDSPKVEEVLVTYLAHDLATVLLHP